MHTTMQLSAEEFFHSPDAAHHSELVRGEVLRMTPPGYEHARIQSRLIQLLSEHVERRGLGLVLGEAGFVLTRDPDTVRAPDVAVLAPGEPRRARSGSYIEGPPFVAIEIRSPSDGPRRLAEAVHDYLAAGTALVWVIDPRARAIHVHRPGMPVLVLGPEDWLEGGEVLPGLRLPVAAITDAAR
jgi:Uma2 family endonuclease